MVRRNGPGASDDGCLSQAASHPGGGSSAVPDGRGADVISPSMFRPLEQVDRRLLGALRLVDGNTGAVLRDPLLLSLPGARVHRNRSGLWVLSDLPALAEYEAAFDAAPLLPAVGSIHLTALVSDPSGRYLPRRVTLALPRDATPANAGLADSLFRPIDIVLWPSPAAPTGANWAVLRISVADTVSGDALGGVLLRITRVGAILAQGLSDWRGEALVAVPGVPVTTWSDEPGAVVALEINATLDAVFDPAVGTRTAITRVRAGIAPATLPSVDPDDLQARRATLPGASVPVTLAAARSAALNLSLALP